jgi:hypothetical protein
MIRFQKIIGRGIAKIEQLLKVVIRPQNPPEGLVDTYLTLNDDANIANFQKILELKVLFNPKKSPDVDNSYQHPL